ncbi:MAG: hypothetical protein E6Y57_28370, partial [Klebsiella oxytoca]|nr:hypothetical protein [Klebsiella oxytoca]MDU6027957.1 hypothetical protein [Klebsiella oxytoca]
MEYDVLRIPGSRLTPYPGYGFTAVCDPVARISRLRRNPGKGNDSHRQHVLEHHPGGNRRAN